MMKKNASRRDHAVSPVVGVMLMLVVTIIIAAVVSAFAGGMMKSQDKTPQPTISATYSQSTGLSISHAGGDPVALSTVTFITTPSALFGSDAAKFAWPIDKSIINNTVGVPIYNPATGFYNTSSFVAGDTLSVDKADCLDWFDNTTGTVLTSPFTTYGVNANARVNWQGDNGKSDYFAAYSFDNPANVGNYFYLDLVDNHQGIILTHIQVPITS